MMHGFQIIGHRGAMGHAPENTLASVRKAIELDSDGVEIDVRHADGHLMVFHDATLERTTDGHGRLDETSFAELRSLDAGGGECIPTLEEVLDLVDGRIFVNVELKSPQTARPVTRLLGEVTRRACWKRTDFLVSSYHDAFLDEIRDSGFRLGYLFRDPDWDRARTTATRLRAFSVHPHFTVVTPEMIDEAHAREWKVFPFTVNSAALARRFHDWGADGVFTDFPDRLADVR